MLSPTNDESASDELVLNRENLEFDPIEADRFKLEDMALNRSLQELDAFMASLPSKPAMDAVTAMSVRAKIDETKMWILNNRLKLSIDVCESIRRELLAFVERLETSPSSPLNFN